MSDLDFMKSVVDFMDSTIEQAQMTNRTTQAIMDQIGEMVERTEDLDLMAGWAARLATITEKEL